MCNSPRVATIIVVFLFVPDGRSAVAEPAAGEDSTVYRQHFGKMLASGFGADPPDPRGVEQHYRALKSLRPDDPRADYGFGLVLMKLHQHSEGVAHIELAAKAEPPYLPAWRAGIRETIRVGDHAAALQQLVQLADQIATPERRDDPASQETADWIGIAVEFLAGPAELTGLDDEILEADAAIRRALPTDLRKRYDQGQQQALAVVAKLDRQEQAAQERAAQTLKQEQSATQARIEKSKSRQEALQEAKQEQQLRVVDTSASLEDQLEQAADRFESLNRSAGSLLQSIQATQLAIQQLKTQAETRSNDRQQNNRFLEAQILARSRELDLYTSEYASTVQSREATARQGQALVARWKATMTQAQRSDSIAAAQLQKFEKLNANLARSLEQAKQTTPRSRQMRLIANRRRSFTTYDPFDLDQEQQRLAAEVGIADN
jgi:hypothetical protein